ncbi:hypothetical protein [Maricaulis sp.]|uniref:hypothetical protein n=1 Tax=Maricaulis sp. TaxID=1486257 RepID=UPI003A8CA856
MPHWIKIAGGLALASGLVAILMWGLQARATLSACSFSTMYQAERLANITLTDTIETHSRISPEIFHCVYAAPRAFGGQDIITVTVLRTGDLNEVMVVRHMTARRDLYVAPIYRDLRERRARLDSLTD